MLWSLAALCLQPDWGGNGDGMPVLLLQQSKAVSVSVASFLNLGEPHADFLISCQLL